MAEIIKHLYMQDKWLVILSLVTVTFLTLGLLLPPAGIIDNSVLIGASIISFLAVLFQVSKAIDRGRAIQISHNGTDVQIQ